MLASELQYIDEVACENCRRWSHTGIFSVEPLHNDQNRRQLLKKGQQKTAAAKSIDRSHFLASIMVRARICANGKAPLVFIERNVKIYAASYQQRDFSVAPLRPRWISASTRLGAGAFGQQDNRRLRRAVSRLSRQGCLAAQLAGFQPDDYSVWTILEEKVSATRYATVIQPKTALTRAWVEITVEQCATIVGNFRKRLRQCIAIQKRAIKLIGDPALTNSLDSLAHRRTISALSLYYIYYHGVCSVELKSIISPKALFTRNTRFSNAQHPFAVKLDKNRTSAFTNSFIPMTSRDWNSLPATVFPATYNLQLFKTRIHRHLQLLPSP